MCCGTIGMPLIGTLTYIMFACGALVLMTRVVASGAVTDAKLLTREPLAVPATELVMIRLKVQAASWAVIGVPSLHFRPSRSLNVHVSLSADGVQEAARYGPGLPLMSREFSVG